MNGQRATRVRLSVGAAFVVSVLAGGWLGVSPSARAAEKVGRQDATGSSAGETSSAFLRGGELGDSSTGTAYDCPVAIYLDADMSISSTAGVAIKRGIETALAENDWILDGTPVELIVKDHHGNTVRSKRHLQEYLGDTRALAVFSGMHSPPLLAHRTFINTREILVLDPWAAAGPITRYPSKDNWIFRLSVDDAKAGHVIVQYAVQKGYRRPALLLEETGWGKSNEITFRAALPALGIGAPVTVKWFNWNLGETGARMLLRDILEAQADVIFLVANAPEAKTLVRVMVSLPPKHRLPICSHWGITGGDFPIIVNAEMRREVDLSFIQTRFSFVDCLDNALAQKVIDRVKSLYPEEVKKASDIQAPAGFAHAYDLTRLLIAAVEQVGMTGDIRVDRRNVRSALEHIEAPVAGLVKTYVKPFGVFSEDTPDAHEALSREDLVMARYRDDNVIVLELPTPR